MIVVGEERTENTVHKTRGQDLIVVRTAFTLQKTARIPADRSVFLFVFYCEGHEVYSLAGLSRRTYGGQQHRVAHAHLYRSISLLGKFAGLDGDFATVGQLDGFFDWIHKIRYCFSSQKSGAPA